MAVVSATRNADASTLLLLRPLLTTAALQVGIVIHTCTPDMYFIGIYTCVYEYIHR